jgi:hypothetical protein
MGPRYLSKLGRLEDLKTIVRSVAQPPLTVPFEPLAVAVAVA